MTADPQKCLSESRRVLKDGGVLACSSWQESDWMTMMQLVPQVRPDKKNYEMPKEWMDKDSMKAELEKAGFRDVESYQVTTTMKYEKLESLVEVFSKVPHVQALTVDFSDEEKSKLKTLMMEEGRKRCSTEPGELSGVSLLAVGVK